MKLNTVIFVATVLWSSATSAIPVPSAQHDHSFRNGVVQFVQDINEGESFREALGITPHRRDLEHSALQKRAGWGAALSKALSGISAKIFKTGSSKVLSTAASSGGKALTQSTLKKAGSTILTSSASKAVAKPSVLTRIGAAISKPFKSVGTKIKGVLPGKKPAVKPLSGSTTSSVKGGSSILKESGKLDSSASRGSSILKESGKLDSSTKGLQRSGTLPIKKTESSISGSGMRQSTSNSHLSTSGRGSAAASAIEAPAQQAAAPSMLRSLGETFISATVSAGAMTMVGVLAQKAMSGGGGEGGEGAAQAGAQEMFVDDAGNLVDGQRNILMAAGTWTQDANGEIIEVKKGADTPATKNANTPAAGGEPSTQGAESDEDQLFTDEAGNLVNGQGKVLMAAGTWAQNEDGEIVEVQKKVDVPASKGGANEPTVQGVNAPAFEAPNTAAAAAAAA